MFELYKFTQAEQKKLLGSITILVDTREHEGKNQHILDYFDSKKIPWVKQKLDYGDYSFMVPANESMGLPRDLYFDHEIVVERKNSLDEIITNMVNDKARIKKELALAPEKKVLLIENADYADMINGNYRSSYSTQSMFGSYHALWHEFNIPIMFMPNAKFTGPFIQGYFQYYLRQKIK